MARTPVVIAALFSGLLLGGHTLTGGTTPTVEQGQRIVHASCETCHSLSPGEVKVGPSLYGALNGPHPRVTKAQAGQVVLRGRNKMPGYAGVFTAAETDSIFEYLRQLP